MLASLLALAVTIQGPADRLREAVRTGIDRGVFPGAVVVVGTHNDILFAEGFGHFTWSGESPSPTPDSSLFDLASLTKVVATTSAIMTLYERGLVELDRPVSDYLEEFTGPDKRVVTVEHLLTHRSGLRAFLDLPSMADDADGARRLVLDEPLRWPPGSRVQYSDLNAILLGWIVEEVTGTGLDVFAESEIFLRAGMMQTDFGVDRSERGRTVPVGRWRGHAIAGEIHDQNAAILGGVSGHAGLYSTGMDLARYAQILLNRGTVDGISLFSEATVQRFIARRDGNRALGWEMRDSTSTDNTGSYFSPAAYGHTGYTGTSMWIDPRYDVFAILLTNRVFAPRSGRSITELKRVRAAVADAAIKLKLGDCAPVPVVAGEPGSNCE